MITTNNSPINSNHKTYTEAQNNNGASPSIFTREGNVNMDAVKSLVRKRSLPSSPTIEYGESQSNNTTTTLSIIKRQGKPPFRRTESEENLFSPIHWKKLSNNIANIQNGNNLVPGGSEYPPTPHVSEDSLD